MANQVGNRNSNEIAYDLSKNILSQGEVTNEDAIEQSLEMIIGTMFNERLFVPRFGSAAGNALFKHMGGSSGLFDSVVSSINIYEPRVSIITSMSYISFNNNDRTLFINLTYAIKTTGSISTFKRTVSQ